MTPIRWVGDRAFLLDFPDAATRRRADAALRLRPPAGVVDQVPAARTVLLRFATPDAARAAELTVTASIDTAPDDLVAPSTELILPTVYDGLDLDAVAAHLGKSPHELIEWHSTQTWTVDFGGFLPGFGYLVSEGPGLSVPRHASPRTKIPAGSVALAGEYTGVYPQASPGGWQLIGRTGVEVWNPDPPALLTPQRRVRFVAVDSLPSATPRTTVFAPADPAVTVLASGPLALIEDLGRTGFGALGVPHGGAADRGAHRLANRLVGNCDDAATIELLLGGFRLRAERDLTIALTGAPASLLVNGTFRPWATPIHVAAGATVEIGQPSYGLRSYLAVRGGVEAARLFGSRSSDPTTGLGPAPLRAGDLLGLGNQAVTPPTPSDVAGSQHRWGDVRVGVRSGPGVDWFNDGAFNTLLSTAWQVSSDSDRVGIRLTSPSGASLTRSREGEMASEGVIRGAIQVPTSGEPLIFLADHPTTGGYPVIAVVSDADTDLLAQCRPGDLVRFHQNRG